MSTLSRRAVLAGGAAMGVIAVTPRPALAASTRQNTIRYGTAVRYATTLDPSSVKIVGPVQVAICQIFDTLVKSPAGTFATTPEQFEPMLAERWETNDARTEWRFFLRRGVQFHKGYGELTADDVAFVFSRHLDPQIITYTKTTYTNIASVEAPSAYEVVFTLDRPDPMFCDCLTATGAYIYSKKAYEELGEAGFAYGAIGTGPYQIDTAGPEQNVLLAANPDYFDGPPNIPYFRLDFIADTTARTLAFASGEVDVIEGARSPGWAAALANWSPETQFDFTRPGSHNYLELNLTRPPLDDLRVRHALRLAIDPSAIARAFGDFGQPMLGIIAPGIPGTLTAEQDSDAAIDDPIAKARELLAEAGFPQGVTIPCYTSAREDYASIMLMLQEQLRAAGITLDLQIVDHATFQADNRRDKNALTLTSFTYPPVQTRPFQDMLAGFSVVKADGSGGRNFSHYGVAMPGCDELLNKTMDEPDFDKRAQLANAMEQRVHEDIPVIPVITLSYIVARSPRIDLGFEVTAGHPYWRYHRARFLDA